jgi:hypothetical protein
MYDCKTRPQFGSCDPVPERLFYQPQLLGRRASCHPVFDSRDRQFLELGGVFLLRYLQRLPFHGDCDMIRHPWKTKYRGKLTCCESRFPGRADAVQNPDGIAAQDSVALEGTNLGCKGLWGLQPSHWG